MAVREYNIIEQKSPVLFHNPVRRIKIFRRDIEVCFRFSHQSGCLRGTGGHAQTHPMHRFKSITASSSSFIWIARICSGRAFTDYPGWFPIPVRRSSSGAGGYPYHSGHPSGSSCTGQRQPVQGRSVVSFECVSHSSSDVFRFNEKLCIC